MFVCWPAHALGPRTRLTHVLGPRTGARHARCASTVFILRPVRRVNGVMKSTGGEGVLTRARARRPRARRRQAAPASPCPARAPGRRERGELGRQDLPLDGHEHVRQLHPRRRVVALVLIEGREDAVNEELDVAPVGRQRVAQLVPRERRRVAVPA
eukprot:4223226-Prymnesium_polylepis.1